MNHTQINFISYTILSKYSWTFPVCEYSHEKICTSELLYCPNPEVYLGEQLV